MENFPEPIQEYKPEKIQLKSNLPEHQLLLCSIIFEQMLCCYKTQYYHENILYLQKKLVESESITPNRLKVQKQDSIKALIKSHKENIVRAEKYNCEFTKSFLKINSNLDTKKVIDTLHDLYAEFTSLIFSSTEDVSIDNAKIMNSAILELSEQGNVEIKGKKYKIHTSI